MTNKETTIKQRDIISSIPTYGDSGPYRCRIDYLIDGRACYGTFELQAADDKRQEWRAAHGGGLLIVLLDKVTV